MPGWTPVLKQYSHEALADAIISNPTVTNAELGKMFNRTAQWVIQVRGSGMFRATLARRTQEVVDPVMTANLEERFEMLAHRSLDVLQEKLTQPTAAISDNLALAAATLGAKVGGLGGFSSKSAPREEAPAVDRIERLAERLTNLNRAPQSTEIVDAVIREVPAAG